VMDQQERPGLHNHRQCNQHDQGFWKVPRSVAWVLWP
jgi:hypothetical protein